MPLILPHDRILFQGDSITDAGRGDPQNAPLGGGYVAQLAGMFAACRPDLAVEILNRGVSGDRTTELLARWSEDCLSLKPQVLSIKIGVNDVWRKTGEWNGQRFVPLVEYQANLRRLCELARSGGVRVLALISPTTIEAANDGPLNQLLGDYVAWGREYAASSGAVWVEARAPLLAARSAQPGIPWTPDGCHPSPAGHALIAAAWYAALMG